MKNKEKYAEQTKKHPSEMGFEERTKFCTSFVAPVVLPQCGKKCGKTNCYECLKTYDEWLEKENKMSADQMADYLVDIVEKWLVENEIYNVRTGAYVDLADMFAEALA